MARRNQELYETLRHEFDKVAEENKGTAKTWLIKEFVANILEVLTDLLRDIED